jgi:hypothetical protein
MVVSRPRASIWQMGMQNGFMGCILFAWASGSTSAYAQDVFVTVASQPVNVGDAKAAALAYYNSGAYQKDLESVASQAVSWINSRAASVERGRDYREGRRQRPGIKAKNADDERDQACDHRRVAAGNRAGALML